VTAPLPRISSRQHPVVRAVRHLAAGRADGLVLLDGAHLLQEALAAGVRVVTVLASAQALAAADDRALVDAALAAGAKVYEAAGPVLDAASPVRTSSGIVATAEWSPASLASAYAPPRAFVVGLIDVQDPGNVGAVIRSADALGATSVLTLDGTADPGGWKTLRGSMGSVFRLPVAKTRLAEALAAARAAGLRLVATVARDAVPVGDADLTGPTLLLLGNEGAGLPDTVAAEADARVTVPMRPGVNSLNVAVTAALILDEARRQRIEN
jgi:TrmH family RNA methyltransferase